MIPLPEIMSRSAATFADTTAVSDGTASLTFAEVEARSNQLANALRTLSRERSGRVAILTPNRVESVELDFAIAKAGKVRVPINTRLSIDERAYLLENSGAETLLFITRHGGGIAAKERAERLKRP